MDPATLKLKREIPRKDILFCLAQLPGSDRLFAGSSDGHIHELDVSGETSGDAVVRLSGHTSYVTGLAAAGDRLISGGYDGQLIWWDLGSQEPVRAIKAHQRWVRKLRRSPDGTRVASVADDMVCRIWNVETGELIRELRGHESLTPQHFSSMLYVCAFSPDGQHLATADRIGKILVWDLESGRIESNLEAPELYTWDGRQRIRSIGGIRSLAFSPDGRHLAAGGIGQVQNVDGLGGKARIEVFDWAKEERVVEFAAEKIKGLVEHLVFAPNGEWLLGAGGDNKGLFMAVDVHSKKILHEETAPMHLHDFVIGGSGDRVYAVGHHAVAIFETETEPAAETPS